MGRPTAWPSWPARSVSWCARLVAFGLVLGGAGCRKQPPAPLPVADPTPTFVADCRPCRFILAPGLPPWEFTFALDSTAEGRAVTAITARSTGDSVSRRLEVHGMLPQPPGEKFFFGAPDLDRDGRRDLLLATVRGVANTYADYWRFAPDTGAFVYLGNYPMLTPDSASGRLRSYERGGEGGRVYSDREWTLEGDSLVVLREEVQEATPKAGEFLRIVRTRSGPGAALREVTRERVREAP